MAELKRFTVRIAFPNVTSNQQQELLRDFPEELDHRPHLQPAQVFWDEAHTRVVVQVTDEAWNADQSARGMAEELFEASSAILSDMEGIHVEVLSVTPAD